MTLLLKCNSKNMYCFKLFAQNDLLIYILTSGDDDAEPRSWLRLTAISAILLSSTLISAVAAAAALCYCWRRYKRMQKKPKSMSTTELYYTLFELTDSLLFVKKQILRFFTFMKPPRQKYWRSGFSHVSSGCDSIS